MNSRTAFSGDRLPNCFERASKEPGALSFMKSERNNVKFENQSNSNKTFFADTFQMKKNVLKEQTFPNAIKNWVDKLVYLCFQLLFFQKEWYFYQS